MLKVYSIKFINPISLFGGERRELKNHHHEDTANTTTNIFLSKEE
jgi:hypothetical protein